MSDSPMSFHSLSKDLLEDKELREIVKDVNQLKKILFETTKSEEQIMLFFEKTFDVFYPLYESNIEKLPIEPAKGSLFADIIAMMRNIVGVATENHSSLILNNLIGQDGSFLKKLVQIFVIYGQHIHKCLASESSDAINEISAVTFLRLSQLFCNILNLYFSIENCQIKVDIESIFLPLFEIPHLRFILALHEYKSQGFLVKSCCVFTSIFYCCFKNSEKVGNIILNLNNPSQMVYVWKQILDHVKLEISEWSLWTIFLALKKDGFLKTIYVEQNITSEYRLLLLDILQEFVESENKVGCIDSSSILNTPEGFKASNHVSGDTLPIDCLQFLITLTTSEIDSFLSLASSCSTETFEEGQIEHLCKLCSLLLKLASFEHYRKIILQKECLLKALVKILKSLQLIGKTNPDSVFGIRSQLKNVSEGDDESLNPAFGFKRDIIGLIANIIHQNQPAQEYLRTSEGLTALLDCAKIDTRNPYILQWSIFAIHNALECNAANQQLVAQLHQQGILKDELVDRIRANSK